MGDSFGPRVGGQDKTLRRVLQILSKRLARPVRVRGALLAGPGGILPPDPREYLGNEQMRQAEQVGVNSGGHNEKGRPGYPWAAFCPVSRKRDQP